MDRPVSPFPSLRSQTDIFMLSFVTENLQRKFALCTLTLVMGNLEECWDVLSTTLTHLSIKKFHYLFEACTFLTRPLHTHCFLPLV